MTSKIDSFAINRMEKNSRLLYNDDRILLRYNIYTITIGCEKVLDLIKEMKNHKIINGEDINKLKQYIVKRFPQYHEARRKEILENTLGEIVSRHLTKIPAVYRVPIIRRLQEKSPLADQGELVFYDVLEVALTLKTINQELLESLCHWLQDHVIYPVDQDIIKQFQQNINSAANAKQWLLQEPSPNRPETSEKSLKGGRLPLVWEGNLSEQLESKVKFAGIMLLCLLILFINQIYIQQSVKLKATSQPMVFEAIAKPQLPSDFHYREIDEEKLRAYLMSRNSILEQEPYFSIIVSTAREFDLNPLVLFAIAGHEQGFVPKDHPNVLKIANNPFNVFTSWQHYNTDISDSAAIAARTVINLAADYPADVDPFQWINRKYAEDENWWRGVRSIFNRLEREVE